MPDEPALIPATDDDVKHKLAHALIFDGRKRFRQADEMMAGIVAEHLLKQLALSGYVVMRRPGGYDLSGVQRGAGKPEG